ncbi:MAG: hypothetical protein LBQ81_02735 [Zoogloeaceae bacterium]|nr:hypothetical protein [Zoogloeaceae bacterium]
MPCIDGGVESCAPGYAMRAFHKHYQGEPGFMGNLDGVVRERGGAPPLAKNRDLFCISAQKLF